MIWIYFSVVKVWANPVFLCLIGQPQKEEKIAIVILSHVIEEHHKKKTQIHPQSSFAWKDVYKKKTKKNKKTEN